jgi:hypothetical protein
MVSGSWLAAHLGCDGNREGNGYGMGRYGMVGSYTHHKLDWLIQKLKLHIYTLRRFIVCTHGMGQVEGERGAWNTYI